MNSLLVRFAVVGLALVAQESIADSSDDVAELLDAVRRYEELCREMLGNDLHVVAACDLRNQYQKQLNAKGWCYGRKGEAEARMIWHKCQLDSLRR